MSAPRPKLAKLRLWLATLVVAAASGQAVAQSYNISMTNSSRPNIGTVSSGVSGDTVFDISTSGVITKASGTGTRISSGTSTATVTISCGNQNQCNSATLNVTITATGSPTGRAGIVRNFDVGGGTASISNKVIGANSTTFKIGAIGKNASKTFNVGMDFPIEAAGPTGSASSSYVMSFDPSSGNDDETETGTAIATVVRSISLEEDSALSFGAIVRPSSGSATVTVNASTGDRTFTGSAVGLAVPAPMRATYTVQGEGARTVSINVPTTITMTRSGGGTLTITTTKTFSGTPSLSGSVGGDGTYSFGVGGSMPLTSSTSPGAYSGTFTITATYN